MLTKIKKIIRLSKKGFGSLKNNGIKDTVRKTYFYVYKKITPSYIVVSKTNSQNDNYKDYVNYIEDYNRKIRTGKNPDFVKITDSPYVRNSQDAKIIAFYLPQYYEMEVNNKFHGRGFTEWTNSSQAHPLFSGHYQPHIPYDVGYYNLLNIDTFKRQIELAKMYGIYGFCFHWYWFSGARTMEKPIELFLEHKELDMPFCINWATENWTSIWDGGTKDIIFEQKLCDDDDKKFMQDILPYFKDSRYIKIDGKPVLLIYICTMFEKKRFIFLLNNFRKIAKENGFPDLYIMLTTAQNFDDDVKEWGADALVEFSPAHIGYMCKPYRPERYIDPNFIGNILDYTESVKNWNFFKKYKSDIFYRSALVSFDNSARKAYRKDCLIFHGATPEIYRTWLKGIMLENKTFVGEKENIVFVNSWNEWAEGSHLEPDMRYGYAYLQATKDAIEGIRVDETIIDKKIEEYKKNKLKITFYVHCIESMGDVIACEPIARYLKKRAPDSKVVWIVKDNHRQIVEFNPNIDEIITVEILSDSMKLIKEKSAIHGNIIIDCHYDCRRSSVTDEVHRNLNNTAVYERTYYYYGCLLESFCLSAGLPKLKESPIFYINPEIEKDNLLPEKYAVIHCTSAEPSRDWKPEKWNELVSLLVKKGINVVEIGVWNIVQNSSPNYFNFTHEHDIQKIAKIISDASYFIGIDSGFAHIANCFNVPAVLIFGKYKNFNKVMPYSGNYRYGNTAVFVQNGYEPAASVSVESVLEAFEKLLK